MSIEDVKDVLIALAMATAVNNLMTSKSFPHKWQPIKNAQGGDMVEVYLKGNACRVFLMDPADYQNYQAGGSFRCADGGMTQERICRLTIPYSGDWYAVVDSNGMSGAFDGEVHLLQKVTNQPPSEKPKPAAKQISTPLPADTPNALVLPKNDPARMDLFISHASEDKDEVARPLAESLRNAGLKVWYDEFSLKIGDSLRRSIDHGIAKSRYGVVIISKNFLCKNWPQYELDGITTRSVGGSQRLLPIWHEISYNEVEAYSPTLADRVAGNTSKSTIADIAGEIVGIVKI